MKLGLFGYPGDHLDRAKSVSAALKRGGADQIICLGGLVWSGRKGEEDQNPPATVLRWLRSEDIPTLCNDTDRQVAGWRLQALENTTGFIKPRIRKLLGVLTREEAQWMYSRPLTLPIGKVLCCADHLTIDAMFPVPLSKFNAEKLFKVMEQKAAFFPSANGPSLLVRRQEDGVIEASGFDHVTVQLDSPRVAGIIGGVVGYPPLNDHVSWGAIVDDQATELTLVCVDSKTHKSVQTQGALLVQRAAPQWHE
jgi:hypothetical protein